MLMVSPSQALPSKEIFQMEISTYFTYTSHGNWTPFREKDTWMNSEKFQTKNQKRNPVSKQLNLDN